MKHKQIGVVAAILLSVAVLMPNMVALARASAPAVPTQESPANGATDLPTITTIRWILSRPGERYRVQVAANAAMTAVLTDATVSDATGYTLLSLSKSATYYWRVNASKNGVTSAWSPVWSFTTTSKTAPAAPTLVSPANGTTDIPASTGPTLVWNAVAGAESYDFMVAPEPTFGGAIVQWYAYSGTSATITGLEEFGEFRLYWRVRGRNPGGVGPWSEVRMFTVDLYH